MVFGIVRGNSNDICDIIEKPRNPLQDPLYKPTANLQFSKFTSCHGCKTRFYWRRSIKTPGHKLFTNFIWKLQTVPQRAYGYPHNFVERSPTGVCFEDRRSALQYRKKDSNEGFAIQVVTFAIYRDQQTAVWIKPAHAFNWTSPTPSTHFWQNFLRLILLF